MLGIAFITGAVVTASSVPMGVFNGAHLLGLIIMATAAILWWRKDLDAWHRVDTAAIDGDLRHMDELVDAEAFKAVRR